MDFSYDFLFKSQVVASKIRADKRCDKILIGNKDIGAIF